MNPMVSIVVPVYNVELYLSECIESVIDQSYKNFELLLINDGSTDSSLEILNEYANRDARIKTFNQENKGVAVARNFGIDQSQGDFLTFLDADDIWDINYLERMVTALEDADMAICGLVRQQVSGARSIDPQFQCDTSAWCWPILNYYSISCCRAVFRRKKVQNIGLRFTTDRKTGEDQEFAFKYILQSENCRYVPDALYYYRMTPNSAMRSRNYNQFDAIKAMQSVEQYAVDILQGKRLTRIINSLQNFKYPYILEAATLSVLGGEERPDVVKAFLDDNGYSDLLNKSLQAKEHWNSRFVKLWSLNPSVCLWYFYARIKVGKLCRKVWRI